MTEFRSISSHPKYRAGSDGSILGTNGKPLRLFAGTGGYLRFTTFMAGRWQQCSVHVKVCEAFHGPRPEGCHAAHINGVRTDNRASNLRWATAEENERDKEAHGTKLIGQDRPMAKLRDEQVLAIRASTSTLRVQAELYGVTLTTISCIRRRKTWKHL